MNIQQQASPCWTGTTSYYYTHVLVCSLSAAMSVHDRIHVACQYWQFLHTATVRQYACLVSDVTTTTTLTILSPAAAVNIQQNRTTHCLNHSFIIQQFNCNCDWLLNCLVKPILRVLIIQCCTCYKPQISTKNIIFHKLHQKVRLSLFTSINQTIESKKEENICQSNLRSSDVFITGNENFNSTDFRKL